MCFCAVKLVSSAQISMVRDETAHQEVQAVSRN